MAKGKHTKAYSEFERVAQRSLHLLSLQQTLANPLPKKIDLSDLSRASIVLAVAAMDAYFTNVFAERLVPYLKNAKPGKSMIAILESAGLNTAVALELLGMKRRFRRIRRLIESHFDLMTTQRSDSIDKLFEAYGIKDFCKNVQGTAKSSTLVSSIQKAVERRHAIVHDGDLNRHGEPQTIDWKLTRKWVQQIVKFVSASDELLLKSLP